MQLRLDDARPRVRCGARWVLLPQADRPLDFFDVRLGFVEVRLTLLLSGHDDDHRASSGVTLGVRAR